MKLDWGHLKTTVERGLHSAQNDERGGLRVHCTSAERMLKGAKDGVAKDVLDKVHRAKTSIEVSRAVQCMEEALALINQQMA